MGTNYYCRYNCCPHCGRYDELHIGKASAGWKFLFQSYNKPDLKTKKDWMKFIEVSEVATGREIVVDEYGKFYSFIRFEKIVELRQKKEGHACNACFEDNEGYDFSTEEFS